MDIKYHDYEYVIMDATALLYQLSNALWASLPQLSSERKLCAASTLPSDIREFRAAFQDLKTCYADQFNADQLDWLEENVRRLKELGVFFTVFKYTDYGAADVLDHARYDAWSLVKKLKNRKTLLITGSETLFQRVLLDDSIRIDLLSTVPEYNQNFFTPDEQRKCKAPFVLDKTREALDTPVTTNSDDQINDLTLYDEDGNPIALEKKWFSDKKIEGSESYIYKGSEIAAKVYSPNEDPKNPTFSTGLQKNIRRMTGFSKNPYFPWVLFPEKLLYHELPVTEDSLIVGYTMSQLNPSKTFLNFFVDAHKETSYITILKILQTTLRRILLLSAHGILVLDYNPNNFWYSNDPQNLTQDVRFLDACSYSYGTYTTTCRSGAITPLVNYKENDRHLYDKSQLIQEHLDLTHLFLLSTMMCAETVEKLPGDLPINFLVELVDEETRLENYRFLKLVPPRLKALFRYLYRDGPDLTSRPFSLEILLEELSIAIHVFKDQTLTFQDLFDSTPVLEEPEIFRYFTFNGFDDDLSDLCRKQDFPDWQDQKRGQDKTPPQKTTQPVRSRAYIPAREHPPVRLLPVTYDPNNHLSRQVSSRNDPLPPVYQWKNRSRPVLWTVLSVLLVLLGLIVADMLTFSGSDLGFRFPLYLENRLQTIVQWLQQLFRWLSGLFVPPIR